MGICFGHKETGGATEFALQLTLVLALLVAAGFGGLVIYELFRDRKPRGVLDIATVAVGTPGAIDDVLLGPGDRVLLDDFERLITATRQCEVHGWRWSVHRLDDDSLLLVDATSSGGRYRMIDNVEPTEDGDHVCLNGVEYASVASGTASFTEHSPARSPVSGAGRFGLYRQGGDWLLCLPDAGSVTWMAGTEISASIVRIGAPGVGPRA